MSVMGLSVIEVSVRDHALPPGELDQRLAEYCDSGARVVFSGQARSEQGSVESLFVEYFAGMTENSIRIICEQAAKRWSVNRIIVVHRVGHVGAGEDLVQVAVSACHRREAFLVCEYVMDFLKSKAPLWKKEIGPQGEAWLDAKISDAAALDRWNESETDVESVR